MYEEFSYVRPQRTRLSHKHNFYVPRSKRCVSIIRWFLEQNRYSLGFTGIDYDSVAEIEKNKNKVDIVVSN